MHFFPAQSKVIASIPHIFFTGVMPAMDLLDKMNIKIKANKVSNQKITDNIAMAAQKGLLNTPSSRRAAQVDKELLAWSSLWNCAPAFG